MTRTIRIAATAALALLIGSPAAAALPADVEQSPLEPTRQTSSIGQYCSSGSPPTQTGDGQTVFCVQVKRTDAFVWWPVNEELPANPNVPVKIGSTCLGEGETWVSEEGRPIVCKKTPNGRLRGNLVWLLQQ
ncbi:hypothetical protein ABZ319_23635 [Nocardia sp. NPDC005978]|uniref:hypothetical protein n=1 Tax=Nocardia sp. NPDC005978 TaxID=3156725 RepID=UPI0033A66A9F